MSKLIYKTRKPKPGFLSHESIMQHEAVGLRDKLPPKNIQKDAHGKVSEVLEKLIQELAVLGYDPTKVSFLIHYKNNQL